MEKSLVEVSLHFRKHAFGDSFSGGGQEIIIAVIFSLWTKYIKAIPMKSLWLKSVYILENMGLRLHLVWELKRS